MNNAKHMISINLFSNQRTYMVCSAQNDLLVLLQLPLTITHPVTHAHLLSRIRRPHTGMQARAHRHTHGHACAQYNVCKNDRRKKLRNPGTRTHAHVHASTHTHTRARTRIHAHAHTMSGTEHTPGAIEEAAPASTVASGGGDKSHADGEVFKIAPPPPLTLPAPGLTSPEFVLRQKLCDRTAGRLPSRNVTQACRVMAWLEATLRNANLQAPGCDLPKPSRLDLERATARVVIYAFLTDFDLTFNDLFHTVLDTTRKATHAGPHSSHFSTKALEVWRANTEPFRRWLLTACKSAAVLECYGPDRQLAPQEHATVRKLSKLLSRDRVVAYRQFCAAIHMEDTKNQTQGQATLDALSALWSKTETFAAHVVRSLSRVWDCAERREVETMQQKLEEETGSPYGVSADGSVHPDMTKDRWFEDTVDACEACEAGGVLSQYKHSCVWQEERYSTDDK